MEQFTFFSDIYSLFAILLEKFHDKIFIQTFQKCLIFSSHIPLVSTLSSAKEQTGEVGRKKK